MPLLRGTDSWVGVAGEAEEAKKSGEGAHARGSALVATLDDRLEGERYLWILALGHGHASYQCIWRHLDSRQTILDRRWKLNHLVDPQGSTAVEVHQHSSRAILLRPLASSLDLRRRRVGGGGGKGERIWGLCGVKWEHVNHESSFYVWLLLWLSQSTLLPSCVAALSQFASQQGKPVRQIRLSPHWRVLAEHAGHNFGELWFNLPMGIYASCFPRVHAESFTCPKALLQTSTTFRKEPQDVTTVGLQ